MWVLAASNSFRSVFEVKAVATVKCQRVDFSLQPLFQTDPVLPPSGACRWPCLVFILCLMTVPVSTSWPYRKLPLRPLRESEKLTCSLQCPVSLCFRSLFVKRLPAMRETRVQSLAWEDPLEKAMATHSTILAWRILWTEEPGRLQSMWSQGVGHD